MPILSLTGRLGLDKTGFDAALSGANKQVAAFGAGLKSQLAAAFGVAAIVAYSKQMAQAVSELDDMAKGLGISIERLQEFEYAAKLSGSSVQAVATGLRALSQARQNAIMTPGGRESMLFQQMGIGEEELRNTPLEDLFRRVANIIRTTDFGADTLALTTALLGRAGQELLPAFKSGLDEAAESARNIGGIIEQDVVQGIHDATDEVEKLGFKLRGQVAPVFAVILKGVNKIFDGLRFMGSYLTNFYGTLLGSEGSWSKRVLNAKAVADAELKAQVKAVVESETAQPDLPEPVKSRVKIDLSKEKPIGASRGSSGGGLQSDSFGRIGAFTGENALEALRQINKEQVDKLRTVSDALTRTGIIIKDIK